MRWRSQEFAPLHIHRCKARKGNCRVQHVHVVYQQDGQHYRPRDAIPVIDPVSFLPRTKSLVPSVEGNSRCKGSVTPVHHAGGIAPFRPAVLHRWLLFLAATS